MTKESRIDQQHDYLSSGIKLSVIIPVYNAEKYLRECLDSVLGQSLTDIEVICVDDGSTDSSLAILQEYENRDRRIKVLHQQNQHAGVARNRGMAVARGEFLHFLDSDDYVLDHAYEVLYERASKYQLDLLKCRCIGFDAQQRTTTITHSSLEGFKRKDFNCIVSPMTMNRVSVVPWNGIYRRAFLVECGAQFSSLFCANDHAFFFKAITNAHRCMVSRDYLVVHRVNQTDSLLGNRAKYFNCNLQAVMITNNQLVQDQIEPELSQSIMKREFGDVTYWYKRFYDDPLYGEDVCQKTKRFVDEYNGLYPELLCKKYKEAVQDTKNGMKVPTAFRPCFFFRANCSKPKVSVILPVYNSEDFLHECLDSLVEQTLSDIEVICVDDGSTDSSLAILQEYENRDRRIKVLHQQNQHAGVARNAGLKIAKGEYLLFLDADDFFEATLCERTYSVAISNDADIVLFDADRYDTVTGKFSKSNYLRRDYLPAEAVFSRKDVPDRLFQITTPCPWTKLFRREFVLREGLKFQTLRHTNDVFFTLVALVVADKVTCVDEVLVHYRSGQSDNLRSAKTDEPLLFFQSYEAVYAELQNRGVYSELKRTFAEAIVEACIHNLNIVKSPEAQITIYERILDESFTKMGALDYPIESYLHRDWVERLLGAKYVVEWHNKLNHTSNPEFHILVDRRLVDVVPAVSVIIPVYNTEPWLEECIDSVLNQTLQNIEVICVDDGSTDNSQSILLEYANKDRRIVACVQNNSGPGTARNNGVSVARGQYLQFVDSDDMLEQNAVELLYEKAEEDSLEIVYFNRRAFADSPEYVKREAELNSRRTFAYLSEDNIYKGTELFMQMVQNGERRAAACFQFFNTAFYISHNLKFPEGVVHEDEAFTFKSMLGAIKTGNISRELYLRRLRAGSIMRTKTSFANVYGYFIAYLEMFHFCREQTFENPIASMVFHYVKRTLEMSRNRYLQLSVEEQEIAVALPSTLRHMFEVSVIDACNERNKKSNLQVDLKKSKDNLRAYKNRVAQIKKASEQQSAEIDRLKKQNKKLKNSRSYRLGKAILWLPRKIKQLFSSSTRDK